MATAAAFGGVLAAHRLLPLGDPAPATGAPDRVGPRILRLELLTSAPLGRMREFYHQALGLQVVDQGNDRLTIAAGDTRLTFVAAGPGGGAPFYHFAFNIPEQKIRAARDWQRARTALLPIPVTLREAGYPEDVVSYRHWNAHSIFFFDPAGNVVEYIARHDLPDSTRGAFDSQDILYASEIGLIVDDVVGTAAGLSEALGLRPYRRGDDQFTALGDERGLLLVMRRGRILSFEAEERRAADVFRTAVGVAGAGRAAYAVPGFPYDVSAES
jgi:hypothetical protein